MALVESGPSNVATETIPSSGGGEGGPGGGDNGLPVPANFTAVWMPDDGVVRCQCQPDISATKVTFYAVEHTGDHQFWFGLGDSAIDEGGNPCVKNVAVGAAEGLIAAGVAIDYCATQWFQQM